MSGYYKGRKSRFQYSQGIIKVAGIVFSIIRVVKR